MRLASIRTNGREQAAVLGDDGSVSVADLNEAAGSDLPVTLADLIRTDRFGELETVAREHHRSCRRTTAPFAPPWRRPGKIWGIGLNYPGHAADLDARLPNEPASFMKPPTAIIGPGDDIVLPAQSDHVTVEAELAVVIGHACRDVPVHDASDVILGVTPVIDATAEDILRRNPRFLTRAKSFDTFFSFGPELITIDECGDVSGLTIRTVVNGRTRAQNSVANMTFDPMFLVAFHSQHMTLEPGDIISTGTPGAWRVTPGDTVRCEIDGFLPLENPVVAGNAGG